jgi:hypothetical protein
MLMRKLIISSLSVLFATAVPAQALLQCVNPDVINALVYNGRSEIKLVMQPTIPQGVEGVEAPASFKLIGSGARPQNGAQLVVGYRIEAPAIPAYNEWLRLLESKGWRRETQPVQQPTVTAPPAEGRLAARLCRNGERRNLLVQVVDGVFYGTIFAVETSPPRACGVPAPQQQVQSVDFMASINTLRAVLPQFTFPATARMSGQQPNGGNSGTNMITEATRIESPDSATSLLEALGKQLATQGWGGDADWKGSRSTGSTWTRKGGDGKPYWGTLEILSHGKNVYDIGFTVATRPQ